MKNDDHPWVNLLVIILGGIAGLSMFYFLQAFWRLWQ